MNGQPPEVRVRVLQAAAGHAADLRQVRLEALKNHPTAFAADPEQDAAADWTRRIQDPNGAIFLAYLNETPAGMAGIFHGRYPKIRHSATIWGVYVQPSFRKLGTARLLLKAATDWARENEVQIVKLAVVTTNETARRFYERYGFEIYGTEPGALIYGGETYDEYLMALRL